MSRAILRSNSGLLLGDHVSCDGFAYDRAVRVQTHIHFDHMIDFCRSKANQTILVSAATRDLLIAIYNADLPYRENLKTLRDGQVYEVNGEEVEIFPSNHMLGSVQVRVTCEDGYRVGYSSDFFWPIDDPIEVDELVVDSTYGDPLGTRRYDQAHVDEKLIDVVASNLRGGHPTALLGFNGRLQTALHLVADFAQTPILCSPKAYPLVDVYRRHGFHLPHVIASNSPEGISLVRKREPCLAIATLPERRHMPWIDRYRTVLLSGHVMRYATDPVTWYGNGDCCVAMTDHADFPGTVEYIKATRARTVWTDPRSGNAHALAEAVRKRLGVEAAVIPEHKSLEWG
jgi:putative mRNA 3-end processing factor